MMKVIDNRFAAREEQWGMILQDLKYDRMWGIKKEENIEYYKEELLSNNPYKSKNSFLLGNFSNINKLDLSAPISLSWQITNKCNSRCCFCCNDSGIGKNELDFEEIKRIAKEILKWDCMRIIIGGGEPLVRDDIEDILKIFENEKVKPAIATNGILLNEKIINQISKSCITLQISLDTLNKDIYTKLRGTDNLYRVKDNIRLAKKYMDNVRIVTVLNRYNENELEEIYKFVEQNNIKQWFVFNLLPLGRGAKNYNELSISNVNELKQKLKALKNKSKEVAIWYWGESSDDGIAIYLLPDGTLSMKNYLKNTDVQLAKEKININLLRSSWEEITQEAKIATLKNFTSKNEL